MKIRIFAASLAASAGLCGAALAQSQDIVSNPRGIVAGYDFGHIDPIVRELGMTTEMATFTQPGVGEQRVMVGRAGGTVIIFLPWACNSSNANKCAGLMMRAYYSTPTSDALRNAFNARWQMTSAVGAGDVTFLQRYLIGDYGYTRGAFAVNVSVFANVANEMLKTIQNGGSTTSNQISLKVSGLDIPTPQAVNAPPGKPMPGDDMASTLNAAQMVSKFAPLAQEDDANEEDLNPMAATVAFDDSLHAAMIESGFTVTTVSNVTIDPSYQFGGTE